MTLLDRLEHRYGRYAVPGLIRYVVALNALVYVLIQFNPYFLMALVLSRSRIMDGEIWRLVTYIFIPQFGGWLPGWLGAAMYLGFLLWLGNGLEDAMGSFRLNVYYLLGMLGMTVAAFLFGSAYSAALLNTSLLFAFAHYCGDEMIFWMYVIPAKVKWIAWFAAALLVYQMLDANLSFILSVFVALANYLIFFGPEMYRNARLRGQVADRRRKFEAARAPDTASLHECAVCHRTEVSNPELEFRVARDGQEYCLQHLPSATSAGVGG